MESIPDILKEIEDHIMTADSNIGELRTIWTGYIHSLKHDVPDIQIDHQGDTICLGALSPGCTFCKNGEWDCIFITSECNLDCEFCISPLNPQSKIPFSAYGRTVDHIVENYHKVNIKGISFSGGEPFCHFRETVDRFKVLRHKLPNHYYWLYTNGILTAKKHIDILADSGMNEIRYNTAATGYDNERVMKIIEYSAKKIANVTVEIPILLKDKEKLLSMIPRYAEAGVKFINLHELMREKNTRSQNLKTENFKAFTLEDGHTTEISLDSRIAFREMIREIKKIPVKINVNFCSLMNKLRQTRKRRNNIIRLIKTPYEKIVDEQFLESVLILGDKENYQFMNPDEWQSNRHKIKTDNNMLIRKIAPMSIFKRSRYISVTKV